MPDRIANIILLVEDQRQEMLLRRYLHRLGHGNREIRVRKAPLGRGSGEQFVREHYAKEVGAVRELITRVRACLMAMIDADAFSVEERRRQLADALQGAALAARGREEPILNLVPKRTVETWALCLLSETVDEETDYRHDPGITASAVLRAAGALFGWTRPNAAIPAGCVPSLRDCLPEFRRAPGGA